jgi:diphosphomevalonate decarboxylase
MKATAIAPSNIAFIKYWGRKDEILRLPQNGSISMNLSHLLTTTTVEFHPDFVEDTFIINGTQQPMEGNRVVKHLDRVRALANIQTKAKVQTENNFPTGTGLSSSASGFAALTVAAAQAAGLHLSEKALSILARQGSGSACRSIPDGFVEWLDGDTSDTSYATSLYPATYWGLVDIVAVVSKERKDVSTSEGQKLVGSSPFFAVRKAHMPEKIAAIKSYLAAQDFEHFGELIEAEALELHAIMLTSRPSLVYWLPGSLLIMKLVKKWRSQGVPVYFTINTGQDIHLICEKKHSDKVIELLGTVEDVLKIIRNTTSIGTRLISEHLF